MKLKAFFLSLALVWAIPAHGAELKISKQYGIIYLPFIVLEQGQIIEKKAAEAGITDLKVQWVTLGGGSAANDALLSGSVDLIGLGVPPFVRLWDKTQGKVKAVSAFSRFPAVLNTNNPNVKTISDFSDKDRIALPSVKVSIQSLVLQMAAAQKFGIENFDKFDKITVAAKHPDAFAALVSGGSEITGHFAVEPFASAELKHPGIHTVLDSYDVLGGPFSDLVLAGTEDFYTKNTVLAEIVAQSLDDSITWIDNNKEDAARLYIASTKSKDTVEDLVAILNNPHSGFSTTPLKTTVFSDFLYETRAIKTRPASWKDLFFPVAHDKQGS